jgi:hypothetical protein
MSGVTQEIADKRAARALKKRTWEAAEQQRRKEFYDECERIRNAPKECTWVDVEPFPAVICSGKWFGRGGTVTKVGRYFCCSLTQSTRWRTRCERSTSNLSRRC